MTLTVRGKRKSDGARWGGAGLRAGSVLGCGYWGDPVP
jgi:hypothetical protein